MTTYANEETLRARFTIFDEASKGSLTAIELCNVFRSLGWTDINDTHCNNLMQRFYGVGTPAFVPSAAAKKEEEVAVVPADAEEVAPAPAAPKAKKTKLVKKIKKAPVAAPVEAVAIEEEKKDEEEVASPEAEAEAEGKVAEEEEAAPVAAEEADASEAAEEKPEPVAEEKEEAEAAPADEEKPEAVEEAALPAADAEEKAEEEEKEAAPVAAAAEESESEYEEITDYDEEEEEDAAPAVEEAPAAATESEENADDANAENAPLNDKPCEKVNFEQFLKLIETVQIPKHSALECYKSFTLFDFTQSGILSENDLAEMAMRVHGATLSAKQRQRMVRNIMTVGDTNKDNLMSLPEYRGCVAKGGVGSEDGPLDLSVLVVDQPPRAAQQQQSLTKTEKERRASLNNNSFNSQGGSRSNRSRAGSASASAYPHSNVVTTVPRTGNSANTSYSNGHEEEAGAVAGGSFAGHHGADAVEEAAPNTETFNFEGIDVTFTDGQISKADVESFFADCGGLLVGEDFERWFEVEDADNDGFLSEEQFRNTLEVFLGEADEQ